MDAPLLAANDGFLGLTPVEIALLIALAAAIYSILRWRRNTVNRINASPRESSSSGASPLSIREVTAEVQALLADLEETSRRLTAQLDNRYTRLEQLMVEADAKIQKLESLAGTVVQAKISEPAVAALSDAQRALSRLRQERGAPPATQDPAYQPIYSLADRGKSPREIAQELGRQPGEIELILALRQHSP